MPQNPSVAVAAAAVDRPTLESLSRPFLDVMHRLTGLESTYLTQVRSAQNDQVILFAENTGSLMINEGTVVDWEDSVCRRSLASGTRATSNVAVDLPGSGIARRLGITSYVGVPVVGSDQAVMGTLCAADGATVQVAPHVLDVMEAFARLIADQWELESRQALASRRADAAEARLAELTLFLAEVEHELKSPLTIIRGWTETLLGDDPSLDEARRQEALGVVHSASLRAAERLDQLLEVARQDVLSHQLSPVLVDLDAMIADVDHQLSGVVGDRHRIVAQARSDPALQLTTDRAALWQVVWHLADNAVKYSPEGGDISIRGYRRGGRVVIEIEDQGIGVPPGIDVFAPFVRGPAEGIGSVGDIAGSGLGLHIVRSLVLAMGGTVSCSPKLGPGSLFEVELPQSPVAGPGPAHV